MATIPQTGQFEVNINAQDITQAAIAINPSGQILDTILFLDVCPQSLIAGCQTSTPDLVLYDFPGDQPPLTQNVDLGPVFYGNPFPGWPLFVGYGWDVNVFYALPHSVSGTFIPGAIHGSTDQMPSLTSPIALIISGATAATVNGQDFVSNLTHIGVTPTLAWGPPSVRNASFYEITVFQLMSGKAGTSSVALADLRTSDTSLTIPPGMLSKGGAYVFRIRAYYVQGYEKNLPNRLGRTHGLADVLSGVMRP